MGFVLCRQVFHLFCYSKLQMFVLQTKLMQVNR